MSTVFLHGSGGGGVDVSGVTAKENDVRKGEYFINSEGELKEGTITDLAITEDQEYNGNTIIIQAFKYVTKKILIKGPPLNKAFNLEDERYAVASDASVKFDASRSVIKITLPDGVRADAIVSLAMKISLGIPIGGGSYSPKEALAIYDPDTRKCRFSLYPDNVLEHSIGFALGSDNVIEISATGIVTAGSSDGNIVIQAVRGT